VSPGMAIVMRTFHLQAAGRCGDSAGPGRLRGERPARLPWRARDAEPGLAGQASRCAAFPPGVPGPFSVASSAAVLAMVLLSSPAHCSSSSKRPDVPRVKPSCRTGDDHGELASLAVTCIIIGTWVTVLYVINMVKPRHVRLKAMLGRIASIDSEAQLGDAGAGRRH
jgi:hypothetical protein